MMLGFIPEYKDYIGLESLGQTPILGKWPAPITKLSMWWWGPITKSLAQIFSAGISAKGTLTVHLVLERAFR